MHLEIKEELTSLTAAIFGFTFEVGKCGTCSETCCLSLSVLVGNEESAGLNFYQKVRYALTKGNQEKKEKKEKKEK